MPWTFSGGKKYALYFKRCMYSLVGAQMEHFAFLSIEKFSIWALTKVYFFVKTCKIN